MTKKRSSFLKPRNVFWKRGAERGGKCVAMLSQIVVPLLQLRLGL